MTSKRVCAACGEALGRKRRCPRCSEKIEYIPPGVEVRELSAPEEKAAKEPERDLATKLAMKVGAAIGATLMADAPAAGATVGEILGEYFVGKVKKRRRRR